MATITKDTNDTELRQLAQQCNYSWATPLQLVEILLWCQRESLRLRSRITELETAADKHPNSPDF